MKKVIKILLVFILFIMISTIVNAYSQDELLEYIILPKTICGEKIELNPNEVGAIKKYSATKELSDEDCAKVKENIDKGIQIIESTGRFSVETLNKYPEKKAEFLKLINETAEIIEVKVSIDEIKDIFEIKDLNGKVLLAENYKTRGNLAYTGEINYTVCIAGVVVISAIVIITRRIIKKNEK